LHAFIVDFQVQAERIEAFNECLARDSHRMDGESSTE